MQIRQMIQHVVSEQGSFVAKVAAIIVIVFGISRVQNAINHIWKLKPIPKLNRKKYLIKRVISLGIFSVIGFILVLSLVINLLIDILGSCLPG